MEDGNTYEWDPTAQNLVPVGSGQLPIRPCPTAEQLAEWRLDVLVTLTNTGSTDSVCIANAYRQRRTQAM